MRNLPGLLMGVVLLIPLLAGCAFSDPRIDATVPPEVSPPSAFTTEATEAATDLKTAWATMAGLAKAEPTNAKWALIADALQAQWLVLVGPDPITRRPSTTATIGEPETVTQIPQALLDADTALGEIRDTDLGRVGTSSGTHAAFWASLAASAEQMRLGLQGTYSSPTLADPSVTVDVTDEPAAWSDLVTAYDEGVFALKTATGFVDRWGWEYPVFDAAWRRLSADLDTLAALGPSLNASPPTLAAAYDLPAGRDTEAAMELLDSTQRGIAETAGRWVASADDPTIAADYLMRAATMAVNQGVGFATWPGWPDS